jgi:hypothetical protein
VSCGEIKSTSCIAELISLDTAYLLVSAVTTLLRCTVESSNATDKGQSAIALMRLLDTLRTARRDHDWDLATLCIETCEQSIERVAAANKISVESTRIAVAQTIPAPTPEPHMVPPGTVIQMASTEQQLAADDMHLPFSLDIPWDHLWDDMAEPWRLLDQHQH